MTRKTISITEARKRIAEITDEVEQKKVTYDLTRYGQVVATLAPKNFDNQNQLSPRLAQEFETVLREYGPALKALAER